MRVAGLPPKDRDRHPLSPWIDYVLCQERDRIMLAFVLAVNAQNNVSSSLEETVDSLERQRMLEAAETGKAYCHELRDRLLLHCEQHGC